MNRSVCRVMMGLAGLAVLGMTATLAGAQTDAVKEKPRVSIRSSPLDRRRHPRRLRRL